MKFSLVSLLVLAIAAQAFGHALRNGDIDAKGLMDSEIIKLLDKLRGSLVNVSVPSANMKFSHEKIGWLDFNMTNFKAENLNNFRDKVDSQLIPMKLKNFTLWFDDVILTAENYNMSGVINSSQVQKDVAVYGSGKAEIVVNLLGVTVETRIDLNDGKLHFPDNAFEVMRVWTNGVSCKFENIMGGGPAGDAFNDWIGPFGENMFNDLLTPYFKEHKSEIIKLLNDYMGSASEIVFK